MKNSTRAAVLSLSVLAVGQLAAQTSGLKAGLWEVKQIKQVMDGKDMTAQMSAAQEKLQAAMANMSPDQRDKMKSMMGGGMLNGPVGTVRVCISAAMAAKNEPMVDKDSHCAPAKISRNGNQTTFEFSCTHNDRTTVGTGTTVATGDLITTNTNMTVTDSKGTHTMQSQSQMTYQGADCQGVTPADQLRPK